MNHVKLHAERNSSLNERNAVRKKGLFEKKIFLELQFYEIIFF